MTNFEHLANIKFQEYDNMKKTKKIIIAIMITILLFPSNIFAYSSYTANLYLIITQIETDIKQENRLSKSDLRELTNELIDLGSTLQEKTDNSLGLYVLEEYYTLEDRIAKVIDPLPANIEEVAAAQKALNYYSSQIEAITPYKEVEVANTFLNDIDNHWGKTYIEELVKKGAIKGYPDNTFRPDGTITRAEFLSTAYKSVQKYEHPRSILSLSGPGLNDKHWVYDVYRRAVINEITDSIEMPMDKTLDQPITRYEMARILIRLDHAFLNNNREYTVGIENFMSDYEVVKNTKKFNFFVEQAFKKGLIAGKNSAGLFDGNGFGTRAEAATMINRLIDPSIRNPVDTGISAPVSTDKILYLSDPNRKLVPEEGDTVVLTDGTKVVVSRGPAGILLENTGVDYYSGIVFPKTGIMFKRSDLGTTSMGTPGQTYLVDSRTGEGHFALEWNQIANYYLDAAFNEYGHKAKVGTIYKNIVMYDGTSWKWLGPVNQ